MTPQIKQKLDQLQRGEVPKGYKKTKQGIIPFGWSVYIMEELYTERKESGIPTLPILTVSIHSGVSDGALDDDELGKKVKRIEDKTQYRTARTGDVVFNMMRAWQGAIGVVRQDGLVSPAYIVATPSGIVHPPFMDYCLKTPQMINRLHRKSYGVTDFRLRLYWDSFAKVDCVLPSLDEQKKIAEILAAQDKLIALKEKLIEEKKRQKKALMQQLITGKKRLPGFEYSWEMHTLKTMSTPILRKAGIGQYEILSISAGIGFVNQAQKFGKEIAGEQYKNYTVLQKHEFSYNKGNSKRYPQGCIYPLENRDRAAVPNVFISFNLDETRCFYGFYKYLFESGYLNKQLYRLINSGVRNDGLLNLYDSDFYNCVIPVPSYDEQKKIANIFFSLDKEIISLEKMLQAEKQKKKALMQLLLTGIVRVKENE